MLLRRVSALLGNVTIDIGAPWGSDRARRGVRFVGAVAVVEFVQVLLEGALRGLLQRVLCGQWSGRSAGCSFHADLHRVLDQFRQAADAEAVRDGAAAFNCDVVQALS